MALGLDHRQCLIAVFVKIGAKLCACVRTNDDRESTQQTFIIMDIIIAGHEAPLTSLTIDIFVAGHVGPLISSCSTSSR